MRDLSVISVRLVQRVRLPFADVDRKWFSVIRTGRIIWPPVAPNKVVKERIGTRGVVRRIRQAEDVVVPSDRESLNLTKLGILQLLA